MAQLALKLTDVGLELVEGVLTLGAGEESLLLSGVKNIHTFANTVRISGVEKAGTNRAQQVEEASLAEAVMNVLGINDLLAALSDMMTTTTSAPPLETIKQD